MTKVKRVYQLWYYWVGMNTGPNSLTHLKSFYHPLLAARSHCCQQLHCSFYMACKMSGSETSCRVCMDCILQRPKQVTEFNSRSKKDLGLEAQIFVPKTEVLSTLSSSLFKVSFFHCSWKLIVAASTPRGLCVTHIRRCSDWFLKHVLKYSEWVSTFHPENLFFSQVFLLILCFCSRHQTKSFTYII